MRKKWTPSEIKTLKKLYPNTRMPEMQAALGKSKSAIYYKADHLGLRRSPEYMQMQWDSQKGINNNPATNFPKGLIPWNKGKKYQAHPNTLRTSFAKGHLPHNTAEGDGVRRKRTSAGGHWFQRVALGKWVEVKTLVWEAENGPIPPKHVLRFIDGDPDNLALENIECIHRSQNMARNTVHQYPEEVKQQIRALAGFKRKLNKIKKNG
jgi:hypothetical protein